MNVIRNRQIVSLYRSGVIIHAKRTFFGRLDSHKPKGLSEMKNILNRSITLRNCLVSFQQHRNESERNHLMCVM